MNLLLIATIGAGAYAYNKNENFKEKVDITKDAIKDLTKTSVEEIKKYINAKKEEK